MVKPQTFDIIAVSIPDSNVQKAVARIMVGADRYLSMQDALNQVKAPPVLLFKGTELKDAEQHIAKLKALGVGFRVVRAEDGEDDDSVMRDDDLPGAAPRDAGAVKGPIDAAHSEANKGGNAWGSMPPVGPVGSVMDAISHHHHPQSAASDNKNGGGRTGDFSGFGSSGGGHGGGGGSGINAGSGMIGNLKKSEAASNKRNRLVSIIMAATLVIIALLFVLSNEKKFNIKRITFPSLTGGPKKKAAPSDGGKESDAGKDGEANANASPERPFGGATPDPERRADAAQNEKRRNSVNGRQKQQANNFIDSARTLGNSPDKQVAFYKIAISFNQYNLQAWHGLLQTYRQMNDAAEISSTEAQMKAIFGEEVNSINSAVTQFGELVDTYTSESGAYRIEYKTKKTSQDEILRDVFNLTRAARNTCKCLNISVFASTSPGNGMMVHSTAATSVYTLPEFKRQAHILWFD